MLSAHELSSLIKLRSSDLGFTHCGIVKSKILDAHSLRLKNWLEKDHNAGMEYMERNFEKRLNPALLLEGAKSIITIALNYYQDPEETDIKSGFSKYAFGDDYHKLVKDKLYTLLGELKVLKEDINARVFVDSAPVLERAWAQESGLGWIGKNSMLINRKSGSFLFLGTVITDLELEYDKPESKDYCGSCTKCIDACPTMAILKNRTIDSRRCISYLSIEKRGDFEKADTSLHGNIFGCDICQDVCPWNNKAEVTDEKAFEILPEIRNFKADQWKKITEEEFNSIFRNSPVLRTGYSGFMRNLKHL